MIGVGTEGRKRTGDWEAGGASWMDSLDVMVVFARPSDVARDCRWAR